MTLERLVESLDWLAMQYVLDELPADERSAFEARLAHDISTCEAVARAAELQAALQATLSATPFAMPVVATSAIHQERRGLRFAAKTCALLAAAWLVMAMVLPKVWWSKRIETAPAVFAVDPAAISLTWLALRQDFLEVDDASLGFLANDEGMPTDRVDGSELSSWMLLAMTGFKAEEFPPEDSH